MDELENNWLRSGDRPRMPDHIDMEYTELYLACVQEKPSKRPSFDTVCRKLQVLQENLLSGPF